MPYCFFIFTFKTCLSNTGNWNARWIWWTHYHLKSCLSNTNRWEIFSWFSDSLPSENLLEQYLKWYSDSVCMYFKTRSIYRYTYIFLHTIMIYSRFLFRYNFYDSTIKGLWTKPIFIYKAGCLIIFLYLHWKLAWAIHNIEHHLLTIRLTTI